MEQADDINGTDRAAPTLHGLPKVDPFVVPAGFFERFPHQVGDAIASRQGRRQGAWQPWMRWAFALPALLLLLWVGLRSLPGPAGEQVAQVAGLQDTMPDELSGLADVDLAAYVEEEAGAIDLAGVNVELNDEEMLAYIATEDIDLAELIIELE